MSARLVNAYVIYNGTNGTFAPDYTVVSINCERLQSYSPRPVWLKRLLAPGDGTVILYEPTFAPTSDELLDTNIIAGLWVEVDGQDVMIDVQNQSIQTFLNACNECCGEGETYIASNRNGLQPDFTPLAINSLCIYRLDDGSAGAHDAFAADYVGQFVGKAQLRSNFSNTSHYTITSYWTYEQFQKLLKDGDTVYNGACSS
jgi:hypothetical protein